MTELTDLSPTRIGLAQKCGLAFKYRYIDQVPAPHETAALLMGNAVHHGIEAWYAGDYRSDSLTEAVTAQWRELLPEAVWEALREVLRCEIDRRALSQAILMARPNIKSPEQTKDFLGSKEQAAFSEARQAMHEACDAEESVRWPKDEDPFQAWMKSAQIAEWLQARWRWQPPPLAVELPFSVQVGDFTLRGRIDQVRRDLTEDGEVLAPYIHDTKTGRQPLTQMEAFTQAYVYYEAVRQVMPELGEVLDVEFLMVRQRLSQRGHIEPERHRALALRVLNGAAHKIIAGQFEPHYGFWCRLCDFRDLCDREIGLWEGDGVDG